jgi:hypothetical protein
LFTASLSLTFATTRERSGFTMFFTIFFLYPEDGGAILYRNFGFYRHYMAVQYRHLKHSRDNLKPNVACCSLTTSVRYDSFAAPASM